MLRRIFHIVFITILYTHYVLGDDFTGIRVDYLAFGDLSYRLTNFYKHNYHYLGGWIENRVAAQNLSLLEKVKISPYLKLTFASNIKAEIPEENNLVVGIGLESRVLSILSTLDSNAWLNWLGATRLYCEYLRVKFMKRSVGSWVPREDVRFGIDLWKEFNVDLTAKNVVPLSLQDYLWAELWADVSWRKTQFYIENYKSWTSTVLVRFGIRFPKIDEGRDIFLMPYIASEFSMSQWSFFWQNRILGGLGLRLMPFQHSDSDWLRRLRIYAEYWCATNYFRDQPVLGTPNTDARLAINFSYNWWR